MYICKTDRIILYYSLVKKCVNIQNKEINEIWNNLNKIVISKTIFMEGNSCIVPDKIDKLYEYFINKKNIHNIAEIGFNAGHSCAVFLVLFPNAKITLFDINYHKYTLDCYNYLDNIFPNRMKLIIGDSTKTVPKNKNKIYDLVHIDGGHHKDVPKKDINNSIKYLCKKNSFLIFDDTKYDNSILTNIFLSNCRNIFNSFVKQKKLQIVKVLNGSTITKVL